MPIIPATDAVDTGRGWARVAAWSGLTGIAAYVVLVTIDLPLPLQAALCFLFAFGLSVASIGLHQVLGGGRISLIAAVANVVAAGLLLGMLLVQLAVKAADPHPAPAFTAVWLGLDVSWDLYVGTGTVLFGACMLRRPGFGPWLGTPGLLAGGLLLALNLATFPTPPAEAGLVDVGPLVALWYVAVSVRMGLLGRGRGGTGNRLPRGGTE